MSSSFNPLDSNQVNSFNPTDPEANRNAVSGLIGCDQDLSTQFLFNEIATEAGNLYGIDIYYYRQDFNPKTAHPIYGDSNDPFLGPYLLKALVNIESDTSILTQFGIENTNDVDLQISFDEWSAAFDAGISPQAGDKFEIKDLLCQRPSGFTRAIFEVTSQGDGDLFEVNKRWFISGQRSDFSFLPNEPKEEIDDQVIDSEYGGLLDNETQERLEPENENALERDVDTTSSKDLRNRKSSVYGGYYFEDEED